MAELDKAEWLRRFVDRIVERGGTRELAWSEIDGSGFEYLTDGFEDDPEASADEAMSYWDED